MTVTTAAIATQANKPRMSKAERIALLNRANRQRHINFAEG